ncbi:MAG TPA: exosortase K [Polyangiaceae bacterium]|nr:exosortase K [Polyangiaceae bacterium]
MSPKRERTWNTAAILAVLGVDYLLKSFAARAGARELAWLLAPTAALVSRVTQHSFVAESGAGYVSRDLFVVIAPVCSGINFAIVVFTAQGCGFVGRFVTVRQKCAWLAACVPVAYVATVLANATRIGVALALGPRLAAAGLLSAENAHRALGVGVYLAFLLGLARLTDALLRRRSSRRDSVRYGFGVVTLASYLAVTLVTPLVRGAGALEPFRQHAVTVLGTAGSLIAVLWLSTSFVTWSRRALGRVVEGTLGPSGVRRVVDVARRHGKPPLSGRRHATLVPPVH